MLLVAEETDSQRVKGRALRDLRVLLAWLYMCVIGFVIVLLGVLAEQAENRPG